MHVDQCELCQHYDFLYALDGDDGRLWLCPDCREERKRAEANPLAFVPMVRQPTRAAETDGVLLFIVTATVFLLVGIGVGILLS